MSWARAYRLTLRLLPTALRHKHGRAMELLFAREVERARDGGRLPAALAGLAGIWDVARRGSYERVRPAPPVAIHLGDSLVPLPTARLLLRRLAASFAVTFVVFTVLIVALYAARQLPMLNARGAPAGALVTLLWLSTPFTAAMTIPLAVLVAVLHQFARLGADGTLAAARRERGGVRRLVVPVLAATVAVTAPTLVLNTRVLPRANVRLSALFSGHSSPFRSDREMTVGELRAAARDARAGAAPEARRVAAQYEIEVQKKFALAAACVVLALTGVAVSLAAPRGGRWQVIAVTTAIAGGYYAAIVTGEDLAGRLVVSPVVGMWAANVALLAAASLALWRRRGADGMPWVSRDA